jgi:hypothetical protein
MVLWDENIFDTSLCQRLFSTTTIACFKLRTTVPEKLSDPYLHTKAETCSLSTMAYHDYRESPLRLISNDPIGLGLRHHLQVYLGVWVEQPNIK